MLLPAPEPHDATAGCPSWAARAPKAENRAVSAMAVTYVVVAKLRARRAAGDVQVVVARRRPAQTQDDVDVSI